MSSNGLTEPFTLYHTTYSVRALMVRLMFAFRGKPRDGYPEMNLKQTQMDLSADTPEQLTEFYLCRVNPDGQVPALTNDKLLPEPLHETLDITWYLCKWYPKLLPSKQEATIRSLIEELHRIVYPVLTFGPDDQHALELNEKLQQILNRNNISNEYRKVLEHKSGVLLRLHDSISAPSALPDNEARSREFCAKIVALAEASGTISGLTACDEIGYIFGPKPTALDAHALTFLRRLNDVKRNSLVPEVLAQWAEKFSKGDIWPTIAVNKGSTLPPWVV